MFCGALKFIRCYCWSWWLKTLDDEIVWDILNVHDFNNIHGIAIEKKTCQSVSVSVDVYICIVHHQWSPQCAYRISQTTYHFQLMVFRLYLYKKYVTLSSSCWRHMFLAFTVSRSLMKLFRMSSVSIVVDCQVVLPITEQINLRIVRFVSKFSD